jgi:hypothetical protein
LGLTVQRSIYYTVQEGFTDFECTALSDSIQAHLGQAYECQREAGLAGPNDTPPAKVLVITSRGAAKPDDEAVVKSAVREAARNFGTVSGEAEITLLRMPEKTVLEHLCRVADVTGFADCESDE